MPPVGGAGSSGRARDAPRAAAAAASPRSVGISGAPPDLSDASKRALRDEAIAWAAQRGLLVGTDGLLVLLEVDLELVQGVVKHVLLLLGLSPNGLGLGLEHRHELALLPA